MGVSSGQLLMVAGLNLFLGYVIGLFFGPAFRRASSRARTEYLPRPAREPVTGVSEDLAAQSATQPAEEDEPEPATPEPELQPVDEEPHEEPIAEAADQETAGLVTELDEPAAATASAILESLEGAPSQPESDSESEPEPELESKPEPEAKPSEPEDDGTTEQPAPDEAVIETDSESELPSQAHSTAELAESVGAVMSSVDRELLEIDFQLRAQAKAAESADLIESLLARAEAVAARLADCQDRLQWFQNSAPEKEATVAAIGCALEHVQSVVAALKDESATAEAHVLSGRLLDAIFQVRGKIEGLVIHWIGQPNEALRALGSSGDAILAPLIQVEERVTRWFVERPGDQLACLLVDGDLIGGLNERHGTLVTDLAWDELYKRVVADLVAGDALVAECDLSGRRKLLWCAASPSQAEELAEQIRQAMDASQLAFENATIRVTASLGLTDVEFGDDFRMTYERVSRSCQAAKDAGRNLCYAWAASDPAIVLPAGVDVPQWKEQLIVAVAATV